MRIYIEGGSHYERLALAGFIKDHLGRLNDVSRAGGRSNAEYLIQHTWRIKDLGEARATTLKDCIILAEEGQILNAL